jgi:hypothetical protein
MVVSFFSCLALSVGCLVGSRRLVAARGVRVAHGRQAIGLDKIVALLLENSRCLSNACLGEWANSNCLSHA